MTLAERAPRTPPKGRAKPRIAPPEPLRALLREYEAEAEALGISLDPWQKYAARYVMALGPRGRGRPRKGDVDGWQYREVCIVAARQNGKTEILLPRIMFELKRGNTVMHTAQDRRLPRKTFLRLARFVERHHKDWAVRKANGQEEIETPDGGRYMIVAPNSGSRGESADLVIIDELREQHDQELMDAMLPTTISRPNLQAIYLSNAGDDSSVVLNDIRERGVAGDEPALAYLEWSAAPEREIDDIEGWEEANPSLGHGRLTLASLQYFFNNRPAASFETEHLCRWVPTMRERLVDDQAWNACEAEDLGPMRRPVMAVSMDPDRTRASAAIAWQDEANRTCLRLIYDGPAETDVVGDELRAVAAQYGIRRIAYDRLTDAELVKWFKKAEPIMGQLFANASSQFVDRVTSRKLRWSDGAAITADLIWTARKDHDESGSYQAVRAKDDRPITASLAAIRAVWLASGPQPVRPRVM